MGMFQHPHLTRGIVKTAKGAFVISRGLVDMPDELAESLGWRPAEPANDTPTNVSGSSSPEGGVLTGTHMLVARRRREKA